MSNEKVKYRKYEICYNDGAFYGEIEFHNTTEKIIKEKIEKEIISNNSIPNKNYHISNKNFKIIE